MSTDEPSASGAKQDALPTAGAIHLNTADGDSEPLKLESMCMRCHETGTTTMMLVNIPHFRDLLIASFECPHCGFRNSEVQFAGAFGERGTRHTLTVAQGRGDLLRRQVVKSNWATASVPELQFEIPPLTQKGVITTVEGLLTEAASGIRELQGERRAADPVTAAAIDDVLAQLDACASGEQLFTLVLDDPAGCSHVEPGDTDSDDLRLETYERSAEQAEVIGLSAAPEADGEGAAGGVSGSGAAEEPGTSRQAAENETGGRWAVHHGSQPVGAPALQRAAFGDGRGIHGDAAAAASLAAKFGAPEEVIELPGHCYACGATCDTRMFTTSIPHFKEVVIMSNSCDACGYRDSEVKPGGGFSKTGRSITLQVSQPEDLSRDVIKSDTAEVYIEELDLRMSTGSLGGLITTVEGLLTSVQDAFKRMRSFALGDSADPTQRARYTEFFIRLAAFAALQEPWTLVISDPLANSFVAPLTEDPAADDRLKTVNYERSAEEDGEFGIDHLRLHDGDGAVATAAAATTG